MGTALYAPEGGDGQAREGKGRRGRRGLGMQRDTSKGKGERGGTGRKWPQPQRSFKQPLPGSPPQVSAAVRAEEETEACRQQAARYEALAHVERQHRRHQPGEPGPDTM